MFVRKILLSLLIMTGLLLTAAPTFAAAPYVKGSYQTNAGQGTITFTPLRGVSQWGYEGKFVINGKTYPGSYYGIRGTSNIGMVWYYGSSGIQAGSAIVSPTGGINYAGSISFTDRQGNVTSSGVIKVAITVK